MLWSLASLSAALITLAGCAGDASAPDCDAIAAALVSRIEVRPDPGIAIIGDSLPMRATAFSCAGQLDGVHTFEWRSGQPVVATISSTGVVMASLTGNFTIFAAVQGVEGSANLTSRPAAVARVSVEPDSVTLGVTRTSTVTARAFDSRGRELSGRPVAWSSAQAGTVSVSSQGEITGRAVGGPVAVSATIEGHSDTTQVTVTLVPVQSVTVTPPSATIHAASTVQLTAIPRDELNQPLTGRAVTWVSSDPAMASVAAATGLVTAIAPGTVIVTATSEGKQGTAQISVTLGPAARLQFIEQPGPVIAGSPIVPAVTVQIQDAAGNLIPTATNAVTVTLPAPDAGLLGGVRVVNAVAGIARFDALTIAAPGTYSLVAGSAGLADAASRTFVVSPLPASRLGFVQQPVSAVAGMTMATTAVEVRDANGRRVTDQPVAVTLAIGGSPVGGALSGTLTRMTANGVASFPDLSIDRAGTGYRITANATGLDATTSGSFDIFPGDPSQLVFIVQPCTGGCTTDAVLAPAPQVAVEDRLGNIVTGSTTSITVTISHGHGMGELGGTTRLNAVAGIATFSDLTVSRGSSGITLRAEAMALPAVISDPFTVIK